MRISSRVGKSTWVSMGPLGWLVYALFIFGVVVTVVMIAVFWPVALLAAIFPHVGFVVVIGWVLTVAWWLLFGFGYGAHKGWWGRPATRTMAPPQAPWVTGICACGDPASRHMLVDQGRGKCWACSCTGFQAVETSNSGKYWRGQRL